MTKLSRSVSKFSRLDWTIFEMSIMMMSLFLASVIPFLVIKVPVWIYFVIFILPYTYLLRNFFSKAKRLNTSNVVSQFSAIASKFGIFDWTTYKVCIFGFTLMLINWSPILIELTWFIYIIVVLILMIYFFAKVFSEK